ncbi:MAG: deoxyribonuclease V [Methyloligellaceae bacterium]
MKPALNLKWPDTEAQALDLQSELAPKVIREDTFSTIKYIAGVDVAYSSDENELYAAAVVLDAETLKTMETSVTKSRVTFPYIPGLFSFRELPPLMTALANLKTIADLIVCDGQGLAHPRHFGLACHLGLMFDTPAIGCGKTRLSGEHKMPAEERGSAAPLKDQGETVGSVLRTQNGVKPVYVSIGHKISLATACDWILKLSPKYRLPETTRAADQAVRAASKKPL